MVNLILFQAAASQDKRTIRQLRDQVDRLREIIYKLRLLISHLPPELEALVRWALLWLLDH